MLIAHKAFWVACTIAINNQQKYILFLEKHVAETNNCGVIVTEIWLTISRKSRGWVRSFNGGFICFLCFTYDISLLFWLFEI
jgi:hypothetical protein